MIGSGALAQIQFQNLNFVLNPQVYYENLPVTEITPRSSQQIQGYSQMVVGLIENSDLKWTKSHVHFDKKPISQEYELCRGEIPNKNFFGLFCSGVFVSPNRVLTAAHCLEDLKCSDFSFVRNAQTLKLSQPVERQDIYTCKSMGVISKSRDLAYVETNETYHGPLPKFQRGPGFENERKIFILGHPLGMALHIGLGELTQIRRDYMMAEVSAFEGNSGSPVFSQLNGLLLGILIEGEEDFEKDRDFGCLRVARCARGECEGEKISLMPNQ